MNTSTHDSTQEADLLAQLELEEETQDLEPIQDDILLEMELEEEAEEELEVSTPSPRRWLRRLRFCVHYVLICSLVFVVLLGATNYEAYIALAKNWIAPGQLEQEQEKLEQILDATRFTTALAHASGVEEQKEETKTHRIREEKLKQDMEENNLALSRDWFGAKNFLKDANDIVFDVEITPYDNRIVIPRIGKNIPLVNVENQRPNEEFNWDDIFMKELEKGVVKYPGTSDPGEIGNSFVFGHSSNFPWIEGNYNDVFALLDNLTFEDTVIVYYNQKKYTYVVRKKRIVKPGFMRIVDETTVAKKELTLMTCWPIGTTLNRLIVTAELIE